jgi:hypothetical protein
MTVPNRATLQGKERARARCDAGFSSDSGPACTSEVGGSEFVDNQRVLDPLQGCGAERRVCRAVLWHAEIKDA